MFPKDSIHVLSMFRKHFIIFAKCSVNKNISCNTSLPILSLPWHIHNIRMANLCFRLCKYICILWSFWLLNYWGKRITYRIDTFENFFKLLKYANWILICLTFVINLKNAIKIYNLISIYIWYIYEIKRLINIYQYQIEAARQDIFVCPTILM